MPAPGMAARRAGLRAGISTIQFDKCGHNSLRSRFVADPMRGAGREPAARGVRSDMAQFDFTLAVLGCRANQEELDAVRSILLAMGGRELPFPSQADLTVVNTCAVTAAALAQSRQELRRAGQRQRGGQVWALGCGAQLEPQALAGLRGVDLVIGNRAKYFLSELLESWRAAGPLTTAALVHRAGLERFLITGAEPTPILWSADPQPPGFLARAGPMPAVRNRALVKIQDGCHQRCRYCIVPHLRGRPMSRPIEEILAEVRRLTDAGFAEIVLTGINLGLYGVGAMGDRDLPPAEHLPRLLEKIETIDQLRRIRLSSLEPMTVGPVLLDRMTGSAKVARHIHLPLQSGADEMLVRMGRPYRVGDIRALVRAFAARWSCFGFGVDVVAGFPGERDEHHRETMALLAELPVTYIHAFAYSARPGTPAASDPDQVPHALRKERVGQLRALDQKLRRRFHERLRGLTCELVIERVWRAGCLETVSVPPVPTDAPDRVAQGEGAAVTGWAYSGTAGEYVRMQGWSPTPVSAGRWCVVVGGDSLRPDRMSCWRKEGRGEGRGEAILH